MLKRLDLERESGQEDQENTPQQPGIPVDLVDSGVGKAK